ncbi:MAG: tetratricopeptide repeat protein [Pseudomonadota bacterium]
MTSNRLLAWTMSALLGLALTACGEITEEEKNADLGPLNAIDATNLTEIMLTVSDPGDAVDFFQASLAEEPDRVDFKRGLAKSLARAGRYRESARGYEEMDEAGEMERDDRLVFAEVLVRENQWPQAEAQLSLVSEGDADYRYNLLNALIADNYQNWEVADRYYANARSLTTRPVAVLNNWGVSHMSRGEVREAVDIFEEAVAMDGTSFGPKNNLVIARGLTGNYQLPVMPLNEEERAQLYHNLALVALRSGNQDIAKGLLQQAVDEHPRYFPAAADKLAALQGIVER